MSQMREPSRADLVEEARLLLGPRGAAFVARWARPAVAIEVTDVVAGRSRFGGEPDLGHGERWPQYDGPGQFVGQIDLAELPSGTAARVGLPAAGLLRVFTPRGDDESVFVRDDGFVVAHFSTAPVARADTPEGLTVPPPKGLSFRECWDLPRDEYQVDDWPWPDYEDPVRASYRALRSSLHGTEYLGGWPAHGTLAYDPTPAGTVALLTLTSRSDLGWCWADGDTLMVFARPQDVAEGRFDSLRSDAG